MKRLKRWMSFFLGMVIFAAPMLMPQTEAVGQEPIVYRNGVYTLEKLSNPTAGEGEADGLREGGDRLNSYAWSMETLCDASGDYLYIGGNRNVVSSASAEIKKGLSAELGEESADNLINMLYNGEMPVSSSALDAVSACIFRYNLKTDEMETWFDSAEHLTDAEPYFRMVAGFRAAISFKGALYMNALTAIGSAIYRISSNSQQLPEVVLRGSGTVNMGNNSQNLRAMAVSADGETLYIGGIQSVTNPEKYDFNVIIYQSTDGTSFTPIADYRDFEFYERKNSGYFSSLGDVWDIVEYKGELYMTLLTLKGALVFKAHKAGVGETGNEYGWVWQEICGQNGGRFAPGFGNALNCAATPFLYKNDLYFITFSNACDTVASYGQSINDYFNGAGDITDILDTFKDIEAVMENETSVYRLTDGGQWQMTVGDRDKCIEGIEYVAVLGSGYNQKEYGTTSYSWRAEIYRDKLYIGTLDDTLMYGYLTKLTNGDLLRMDSTQFRSQLDYTVTFLKGIIGNSTAGSSTLLGRQLARLRSKLSDNMINNLLDILVTIQGNLDEEATVDFIENVLLTLPRTKQLVTQLYNRIEQLSASVSLLSGNTSWKQLRLCIGTIKTVLDQIDTEGLESYVHVSRTISDNRNVGAELYCTEDGIHFDTVTLDGFHDRYNAGIRTLSATEYGLMVGTANTWYGAQLWRVTEETPN